MTFGLLNDKVGVLNITTINTISMNNKYTLVIVILILVFGGGILAYSNKTNPTPSSSPTVSISPSPTPAFTSTPEPTTTSASIGPTAIFSNVDMEKWQACKDIDCIAGLMKESGASSDSINFTKLLYKSSSNEHVYLGFLGEFQETGKIDVGRVYLPNRVNTNEIYYLLNGSPALVSTEINFQNGEIINKMKQDSLYPEMKKKYPKIEPWGNTKFVRKDTLPKNGERFIFTFILNNGCHACETEYAAIIGFDFDPNGKFLKTTFLKIVIQSDRFISRPN